MKGNNNKLPTSDKKILEIAARWLNKMAGYTIFSLSKSKQRRRSIIDEKEEIEWMEREVEIFMVGDFLVDTERLLVYGNEQFKTVKPDIMFLLMYFIKHQGSIISKEEISCEAWPGETRYFNDITILITQLRIVFGDSARTPRYIETYGHKGYSLVAKVEQVSFGVFVSKAQPLRPDG